jgi:membrane protein required for colicin V production
MNWLDILLMLLLAASVISAFMKGLTRELVGLVAVICALLLGSWFYGMVAGYLLPYLNSRTLANVVGFILVFGVVIMLGALVGRILRGFMKITGLSFIDRLLGAVFGFVRGVLYAAAVLIAVMAFTPGRKTPQAIVHSSVAPYVMEVARGCVSVAPYELREGFRASYVEARSLWRGAVRKALPSKTKE